MPAENYLRDVHDGGVVQAGWIDSVKFERHVHRQASSGAPPRWVIGAVPPRVQAFQYRIAALETSKPAAEIRMDTVVMTGSTVISGLGGVGKTQLAAEHARRLWDNDELDVLMWVAATSRDAILSTYTHAAAVVGDNFGEDSELAASQWLGWLTATKRHWLVVLDDLQDPSDVVGLWPPHTPTGYVVATTRRQDASLRSDGRHIVKVGLFTPQESLTFLTKRLSLHPGQGDGADQLAKALDHLPVALAQAAAYISDRPALTCTSYLRRWTDRRRRLSAVLPAQDELPDEHRETIATTWSLSIDRADGLTPAGLARPLLEIASLLDPNGIPRSIFGASAVLGHLESRTGQAVDEDDITDGLSALARLNLIGHDPGTLLRTVRIHALVQRATREALDAQHVHAVARVAADGLAEVWPEMESDPDLAAVLRSNTEALRDAAGKALLEPKTHTVLFRAGSSLGNLGQVNAAVAYYKRLRTAIETSLGSDHLDALSARNTLAWWTWQAGDPASAAVAYEHLLPDCRRILGNEHPETLSVRTNIARWRGGAGDAAGAVKGLSQVLADLRRILGVTHRETLLAGNDLAWWRGVAGDPRGAVAALKHVVVNTEQALGPNHRDTLLAQHSLAWWSGVAGDSTGAVDTLKQLTADTERNLGADHPASLSMRHSLVHWQGKSGDLASAAIGFQQLLVDRERILGPDHPDTHNTRRELALWQTKSHSNQREEDDRRSHRQDSE